MAKDQKIELNTPDLLARYHKTVEGVAKRSVAEALHRHKRNGTSVAIAKNGEIVIVNPEDIAGDSLAAIWDNEQDDVYAELLHE